MIENATRQDVIPAAMNGVYSLVTSMTYFFLAVFLRDQLGFSGTQIGALFAAHAIAGVVSVLPAGLGNDRVTSRALVAIGLAAQGLAFMLMGTVKTFPIFFAVFVGYAISFHLYRLSMDMQVLKTREGGKVPRRVVVFQTLRFFGLTTGTAAAGYMIASLDFSRMLIAVGLVSVVLAVAAKVLEPTPIGKVSLRDYKADISRPRVLLFAGWFFLFASHWGAEHTCYGLFLSKNLGLGWIGMGWYMAGEFFAIVICYAALIRLRPIFDRAAIKWMTIAGLIASGIGHLGMPVSSPWVSGAFRMLHGAGDGLITIVLYLGIAKLFHVERLGGNAGFINLAAMAGMVSGSLIYGPMGERMGYHVPIIVSGVLILALAVPVFFLPARRERGGAPAAVPA